MTEHTSGSSALQRDVYISISKVACREISAMAERGDPLIAIRHKAKEVGLPVGQSSRETLAHEAKNTANLLESAAKYATFEQLEGRRRSYIEAKNMESVENNTVLNTTCLPENTTGSTKQELDDTKAETKTRAPMPRYNGRSVFREDRIPPWAADWSFTDVATTVEERHAFDVRYAEALDANDRKAYIAIMAEEVLQVGHHPNNNRTIQLGFPWQHIYDRAWSDMHDWKLRDKARKFLASMNRVVSYGKAAPPAPAPARMLLDVVMESIEAALADPVLINSGQDNAKKEVEVNG